MLIWILALVVIALLLAAQQLAQVLRQIPERNEDFDALSSRMQL